VLCRVPCRPEESTHRLWRIRVARQDGGFTLLTRSRTKEVHAMPSHTRHTTGGARALPARPSYPMTASLCLHLRLLLIVVFVLHLLLFLLDLLDALVAILLIVVVLLVVFGLELIVVLLHCLLRIG
jgi:hypothetical protein